MLINKYGSHFVVRLSLRGDFPQAFSIILPCKSIPLPESGPIQPMQCWGDKWVFYFPHTDQSHELTCHRAVFPLLHHLVVVVFIIALLNIALLKVNMRNSDTNRLKKTGWFCLHYYNRLTRFFTEILILLFLNVVFQESERQKDQSIRKYEQEIDSLQFRNDQVRQVFLKY